MQTASWAARAHPKEDEAHRRVSLLPRRDVPVGTTHCPPRPPLALASSQDIQTSDPRAAACSTSAGTALVLALHRTLLPGGLPRSEDEAVVVGTCWAEGWGTRPGVTRVTLSILPTTRAQVSTSQGWGPPAGRRFPLMPVGPWRDLLSCWMQLGWGLAPSCCFAEYRSCSQALAHKDGVLEGACGVLGSSPRPGRALPHPIPTRPTPSHPGELACQECPASALCCDK